MKNSKISIGLAVFSLAIGSIIETRANKNFSTFIVRFNAIGLSPYSGTADASVYTSVRPFAGQTVVIKTATNGSILATMKTNVGLKRVYHK